ncbi:uncharacterized protein BDV17DRAFT_285907 [Aspergillus undulatus]|uniref:uncharacterized protein n=1 Tax=Aspergillus undulatus TaxID=1810928 RepID=UPI003CCDAF71
MENRPESSPPDQSYLLRLPDELLDNIIAAACSLPDNRSKKYDNPTYTPAAICLVSRRFYRIAVPHLYSKLCIDHRQGNAYLNFIKSFTEIKSFALSGFGGENAYVTIHDKTWAVLRSALASFSGLTDLSFAGNDYALELVNVIEALGNVRSSKLQELELDGISWGLGIDTPGWRRLQAQAGTTTFTTLRLRNFMQTPEVLAKLVRWPASLEIFDLNYTLGTRYDHDDEFGDWESLFNEWSRSTLQTILEIHKTTLRSITIRCINKGRLSWI